MVIVSMPQASVEPLSTSIAVMLTSPFASRYTVRFWQARSGSTSSTTVAVDVQVETFPFTSVTVSSTVFGPMSEQSKLFTSIDSD